MTVASDLKDRQHEALLLDVRTPAEFEEAHIPGSISHPLAGLDPDRVREWSAGKPSCVLVCGTGKRARQAADKLAAAGLKNLEILDGGVTAWKAAGLPLKQGQATISLERQVRIAAGALVLLGAVLGYALHPAWLLLSGFVGAGLVFAGITDTCGMGMLLARMPWNTRSACCGRGKEGAEKKAEV